MTVTVKNKIGLTVPPAVQRQAGFRTGDVVEFKVSGGMITVIPKVPATDAEYTQGQRRIIDAQLDEAERGPFHGPFNTADEMITHMKSQLRNRTAVKKTNRSWRRTPLPRGKLTIFAMAPLKG